MGLILCITHTSPFLCASRYAFLRCALPARSTSTKANILKFNSRPSLRFCIVSRCNKWLHAHWKRRNPLIQYASCEGYSVFPMCYYYEQYRRQLSSCSFQIFCSIICLLCCFYSYGTFFNNADIKPCCVTSLLLLYKSVNQDQHHWKYVWAFWRKITVMGHPGGYKTLVVSEAPVHCKIKWTIVINIYIFVIRLNLIHKEVQVCRRPF